MFVALTQLGSRMILYVANDYEGGDYGLKYIRYLLHQDDQTTSLAHKFYASRIQDIAPQTREKMTGKKRVANPVTDIYDDTDARRWKHGKN